MGISISNFSDLPHEVFQVLPRYLTGQIFNNHTVVCTLNGSVLIFPLWPAPRASAPSGWRATPIPEVTHLPLFFLGGAPGVFHDHSFPQHLLPIQLIDGIFSISLVFKFNESVVALKHDIVNPAKAVEEPLDIPLFAVAGQVPNVDPVGV